MGSGVRPRIPNGGAAANGRRRVRRCAPAADWRVELAVAGFDGDRRRRRRRGGPWPNSVFWGRAPSDCNGRHGRAAAGAGAAPLPIALIATDPVGAPACASSSSRRAPGQRDRSGRVRGRRPMRRARRVERHRGVGEVAVLVVEERRRSDRAGGAPDRACCRRWRRPLRAADPAVDRHDRRAAGGAGDFADGGTPVPVGVVGAALGLCAGAAQRDPASVAAARRFPAGDGRGPSAARALAGELAAASAGNRDRLDPGGPPRAAAAPRSAAALGGSGRCAGARRRDRRAGSTALQLAAGRARDRRDRARSRSRCMPPGSISAT